MLDDAIPAMAAYASHYAAGPGALALEQNRSARVRHSDISNVSNNTYMMAGSPLKKLRMGSESFRPKVQKTGGQKLACLVNASVTHCGNDQIYAFGGFDQYTDEGKWKTSRCAWMQCPHADRIKVYNHVLKLDLSTLQWSLVDNYGDIPGVRMGHTSCLWQGSKLLIFGGENEHREFLSDVVIFDVPTATWTQPDVGGAIPKGRARHASVIYDEKLFTVGGLSGKETLDDICYLDLKTWTWSRSWTFVGRFDHAAWVWGGRIWIFGGLGSDMERNAELLWLDIRSSPAYKGVTGGFHSDERAGGSPRPQANHTASSTGSTGYAANSSSVQIRGVPTAPKPIAPGAMSSVKFVSGPHIPSQAQGTHFHLYSSGTLLDFVTPSGTIRPSDCNLSSLELNNLQWQKIAEGPEIFDSSYRWHYCTLNEDGTKAWLLGSISESQEDNDMMEEYLSEVLTLDLRRYGLLGSELTPEPFMEQSHTPRSDSRPQSLLGPLGTDLASMFDGGPENGTDFTILAEQEASSSFASDDISDVGEDDDSSMVGHGDGLNPRPSGSKPIYVHRIILQARWPHFNRVWSSHMAEFQTKKMRLPESYPVVRAFLFYLYTDSIAMTPPPPPAFASTGAGTELPPATPLSLDVVAGLLVLANMYDLPRLRLLCVHRLSRDLDTDAAAIVWERAALAGEDWLRCRAARYCLTHWGRVVRSQGFRKLSRGAMVELCEVVDVEGRVVGGEELALVGGLGGAKIGQEMHSGGEGARRPAGQASEDTETEDEAMEVN